MVNPGLIHARWAGLWVDVPMGVSKKDALEQLALVDDVTVIVSYSGRWLGCAFLYREGTNLQNKVRLIVRLLGCRESIFTDIPIPPCDIELSRTDLQIILSRQADMTKSNRMVAEELGISSRTVKRRLMRMVDARAVWPIAYLDVNALGGRIFANLMVVCRDPGSRHGTEAQIVSMLDDYLFFNAKFVDLTIFNLLLPSVPIGESILDGVARMDEVSTARIGYVADWIGSHEIVRDWVKRLAAQRAAR